MLAVYEKEIKSYFHSMIAYLFLALFWAASGVYFTVYCLSGGVMDFGQYVLSSITILFIIIVPVLTMRLMADEKKQKTDQLFLTAPVRVSSVILGKYLAVLTLFGIGLLGVFCQSIVLSFFGDMVWRTNLTAFIGFFLMGACFLAIGTFISCCTESQVASAAISFGVVLFCFLLPNIVSLAPGRARYTFMIGAVVILCLGAFFYHETHSLPIGAGAAGVGIVALVVAWVVKPALFDDGLSKVVDWISILDRYDNFINGIFDGSSIIYYLSFIAVFLYLSIQTIEKKRWI
jgi:ABC-2 type transport system permease protein